MMLKQLLALKPRIPQPAQRQLPRPSQGAIGQDDRQDNRQDDRTLIPALWGGRQILVLGVCLGMGAALGSGVASAQGIVSRVLTTESGSSRPDSHFGRLVLDPVTDRPSTNAVIAWTTANAWTTGGSSSLTAIANFDDRQELCAGYSYNSAIPDHVLELSSDFDNLSITVNTGGKDTTLLIEGPQGVYCGDDATALNADALVQRDRWAKGLYRVWVGSGEPNQHYSYQLQIQQGDLP